MKTSVVMCTYNGEKYLIEQLDSLRKQTRKIDEVIICDDCSNDGTADIVNDYIRKYELTSSWHFFINKWNKGYADNFHDAMMMSTGDLIFFCDQDDIWHLDKVDKSHSIMEKNEDILVLYSNHHDFFNNDCKSDVKMEITEEVNPIVLSSKSVYLGAPGCAMVVRKVFINSVNRFWYSNFAHDEFIWKMGLSCGKVWHYDTILVERRCHNSNTSKAKLRTKAERINYIENLESSYCAMMKAMSDTNENVDEKIALLKHNLDACELRIRLLKECKIKNAFMLLFKYRDTVKTYRTILIETYIALRKSENE